MDTILHIEHPANQPIRVVQITDCHLEAQPNGKLLGMDTDHSLECVLDLVSKENPTPDVLLCTGDLSNKGGAGAYRRFGQKIKRYKSPSLWLMGNHDRREVMSEIAGEQAMSRIGKVGKWRIMMLDSSIPGRVEGNLDPGELAFLEQSLQDHADAHFLVCLHHHVLPVGCDWLDQQRIANADELLNLLSRYDQVKMLLSGHVHQHFENHDYPFQILTSPSTCIQFAPNQKDFKLDTASPGYRWLQLNPDGSIDTDVSRVTGVEFTIDYASSGY